MTSGINIAGGLAYSKIWDDKTNDYILDPSFKLHCDYCGIQLWKGYTVTYYQEPETFSLCGTCMPLVFDDPDGGKILMLGRRMETSARAIDDG